MKVSRTTILTAVGALLLVQTAIAQTPRASAGPVDRVRAGQPQMRGTVVARAHADIVGQGISGTADFVERRDGTMSVVEVHLIAKGLKPGLHGVHLHAVGKCEPDFAAAGGHFDPGPAGNTDPDANHPFHMGDLPQVEVGANGEGRLDAVTTRVTISDGPLTLMDADGSAIILHGNPDQGITGEPRSGVSGGPRVACGVIRKM